MTATVWAISGKQEIIGIDLVLLIVIAIMIWARWRGQSQTAMTASRFPPPWSIGELNDACFVVRSASDCLCSGRAPQWRLE